MGAGQSPELLNFAAAWSGRTLSQARPEALRDTQVAPAKLAGKFRWLENLSKVTGATDLKKPSWSHGVL